MARIEDSVDISTRDEESWLSAWQTFRLRITLYPPCVGATDRLHGHLFMETGS